MFACCIVTPFAARADPNADDWDVEAIVESFATRSPFEDWDARIEYSVDTVTTEAPRAFFSGDEALLNRPFFATLQHRFVLRGRATPYVGVGAGYAVGFDVTAPKGALALKGIIGADVALVRDLDVFVELGYAREAGSGPVQSGQINTGLKLRF